MRVGVIGAGAAGLAAAYELGKHGHEVAVYERASFLGGQASTFQLNGARLERGYHHLFTSDTDILDLIDEIGLGHRMRWIESKVGVLYDGKTFDFVTPLDLLRFTPLSLVDRVRLGLGTLRIRRIKDWRSLESVTADEWLRTRIGTRAYEGFWGPMLRGKFGDQYYREVGMAWVWAKIHSRFASRSKGLAKEVLGYPIGSFGEVFDVLAERIAEQGNTVKIDTPVSRIIVENGMPPRLEVETSDTTATEAFDCVISTTQNYIFMRLLPSLPEELRSRLGGMRYLAAVLLILVLDRPLSRLYWLNVADRSIPFVGVVEQTNLIGPEHYGGRHVVYLSNYLSREHRLYKLGHEELLSEYLPHLRKVNPDFSSSWVQESYHQVVNAAQPIIGTDYSAQIPDHRTPFRGVYLANTTQVYPEDRGTNYSVRMGKKVAWMVMEDFAA